MAIKMALLDNGVLNYGYSVGVIGVGKAGEKALTSLNILKEKNAISKREGGFAYIEEKSDPLNPCKKNDWLFILADMGEEESFNAALKCVKAHSENRTEDSFSVLVTYKKYEPIDKALSDLFDVIIYTDADEDLLRRPIEQIIFETIVEDIDIINFRDIAKLLTKCKTMYYKHSSWLVSSVEEVERTIEAIKSKIRDELGNGTYIQMLISGKACNEEFCYEFPGERNVKIVWDEQGIAVYKSKPLKQEERIIFSLLYGYENPRK